MINPELIKLIEEYAPAGLPEGDPAEVSLYHDLGIDGDEADELLNKYRRMFGVSLVGFVFDDHFPGEGDTVLPSVLTRLPWMKPGEYLPLTVADLQMGIESGYLGTDPATVAKMHLPLTPEEEQQVESAVFRLKNRLIYLPFLVVVSCSVGLGAISYWWLVPRIDDLSGETAALMLLSPWLISLIALWLFVTPRYSLLKFPAWKEKPGYHRTWGGYVALPSFLLPVMVPILLLYNYFETGRSSFLLWAIVVFVCGLIAFLAFIHTYPFEPQKLKRFARNKGIDIKPIR